MEEKVTIENINLTEVLKDATIPERIKYILEGNPYADGINHVAMIRGVVDGKDGGRVYTFLSRILKNKERISVFTASTLSVEKEYRKYMFGLTIPESFAGLSPNGITYGAGCSRDARPVYVKYLGYKYFPLPRYIYLRKTRPLLNSKLSVALSYIFAPLFNLPLSLVHLIHYLRGVIIYSNYRVKEGVNDEDYFNAEKIAFKDNHKYQEEHNAGWFKWVLNAPASHPGNYQKLFLIYENNTPIGYWLVKVRYAENIRGQFKNLYVGTITDWGVMNSHKLKDKDVLSMALHCFAKYVDVIQTFTESEDNVSRWPFLKKKMGESNFFILVKGDNNGILEGYNEVSNWRLRPAMADTMFD